MIKFIFLVLVVLSSSMLSGYVSARDLITLECPIPSAQIERWVADKPSFIPEHPKEVAATGSSKEDWYRGYIQLFSGMVAPEIVGIEIDLDFDNSTYVADMVFGGRAVWSPAELQYTQFITTGDAMIIYTISRETLKYSAVLTPLFKQPTNYKENVYWRGSCVVIEKPDTIF